MLNKILKFTTMGGLIIYSYFLNQRFHAGKLLENVSYSKMVFSSDGTLLRLGLSHDDKFRLPTILQNVDSKLIEAFLIHEDKYFYYHFGVNPGSLLRAVISHFYGNKLGGSTITMQLARLKYGIYTKNFSGKLEQILKAIVLEINYSKKEILESYLTLAPFGSNIEGIEAANIIYFSKTAAKLSLSEVLTLALIPQSPLLRSLNQNSSLSEKFLISRKKLLRSWLKMHPEDKDLPIDINLPFASKKIKNLPFLAPHLVDLLIDRNPEKTIFNSTIDLKMQMALEDKIKEYLEANRNKGLDNAAAIVLNVETMEVKSLVGSSDFFNSKIQGQVNGVIAKRSPGSTLKPLLYALALDQGLIHSKSLIKDTPFSFAGFNPENFDRSFLGPVAADDALIFSRNIPAVYLDSQLKHPTFYEFLKNANIKNMQPANFYGLSLSLGGGEVTMEELVHLYSMLTRRGMLSPIRWLKDEPRSEKISGSPPFISAEASFIILDILSNNPRPEGQRLNSMILNSRPVAWKTGTSYNFKDAWSVGAYGPYVLAVWIGNFDGKVNPSFIGREAAGPLFFQIVDLLSAASNENPRWTYNSSLNVKKIKVCAVSGYLPGPHCHHQKDAWFIPGKSPITICNVHRKIFISNKTGKRVCTVDSQTRSEVFEFWPTDLQMAFNSFGISKRPPPDFESQCFKSNPHSLAGVAPVITSPKQGVQYKITLHDMAKNSVPLQAILDSDVDHVNWFINNEFIGSSKPGKPLWWNARPGKYIVRAVDQFGRFDMRDLNISLAQ